MKDSINSLVTRKDVELALPDGIYRSGGEGDTSDLVNGVVAA